MELRRAVCLPTNEMPDYIQMYASVNENGELVIFAENIETNELICTKDYGRTWNDFGHDDIETTKYAQRTLT